MKLLQNFANSVNFTEIHNISLKQWEIYFELYNIIL